MQPSDLVVYVDVDDTLVRQTGSKRVPMVAVVEHVPIAGSMRASPEEMGVARIACRDQACRVHQASDQRATRTSFET